MFLDCRQRQSVSHLSEHCAADGLFTNPQAPLGECATTHLEPHAAVLHVPRVPPQLVLAVDRRAQVHLLLHGILSARIRVTCNCLAGLPHPGFSALTPLLSGSSPRHTATYYITTSYKFSVAFFKGTLPHKCFVQH